MTKKVFLSVAVAVAFVIYSVHQRHEGSRVAMLPIAPKQSGGSSSGSTPGSSSGSAPSSTPAVSYKDGQYTGTAEDAVYGYIQVKATIQGGKLSAVDFLQYPNDQQNSIQINDQAMPLLQQEALSAQSAQVDGVSGATDTSQAFRQSLASALAQAKS